MKIATMICKQTPFKNIQHWIWLCLLFAAFSMNAQQSPSCSACMGYSHDQPDEHIDVLIKRGEDLPPSLEKAARYGETVVYGGDVILTDDYSNQIALRGNIISDLSRRWSNSTIPYIWGSGLSTSKRTQILNAIQAINTQTNLCVVERTNESAFIEFQDTGGGCYVYGIGDSGTPNQVVHIGQGCYEPQIIHEILHKAGFYHEQTRPDRDGYITVNWDNLDGASWRYQFTAQGGEQGAGTYDFGSIMHYPQYHPDLTIDDTQPAFWVNNGVTVPSGVSIGNMSSMSSTDIAAVNQLYSGCTGGGGGPTCSDGIQNQGETSIDCGGPCPSCATCFDGIQNQGEVGVDCGGPCPACNTNCNYTISNNTSCLYDVFWWDGSQYISAGRVQPYSSMTVTAQDGMQFGVYNAYDYGQSTGFTTANCANPYHTITQNVCSAAATCNDNIQNQGETGIDCGGPCPACPTCFDGIQNQGEQGIDCGGPCPACMVNCNYNITNNTSCNYDIFWWDGAAYTYAGRVYAYSNTTVTAEDGIQFAVFDTDDYSNGIGYYTVNCSSPSHTITETICAANTSCTYTISNSTNCTYDIFWWDGSDFTYAGRINPYGSLYATATNGIQFGAYDVNDYSNNIGFNTVNCASPSYNITQSVCGGSNICTYTMSNYTYCTYDIFWWDGSGFNYAGRVSPYSNMNVTATNGMQFGVYDVNNYNNNLGFYTAYCSSPSHSITQAVCANNSPGEVVHQEAVMGFTVRPNPLRTQGVIEYDLSSDASVTIFVSDLTGKKVATLSNHEAKSTGLHQVNFDAAHLSAGMYYCTIVADDFMLTEKIVLTK